VTEPGPVVEAGHPSPPRSGPLRDVRVVEVGSIGPGPFAAMLLADLGADVIRLDRLSSGAASGVLAPGPWNVLHRGRPSVGIDLKRPEARALVLRLCESADVLVEGFRPGVMERLGLGPADVHERRPQLVYGRMTGYGQDGPMAAAAGHDINYIATAGILGAIVRRGERPLFPLNLLGDFGGGGMLLAFGVVSAVLEARASGRGQVVDAAMVDGAPLLATLVYGLRAGGFWSDEPGTNFLDSGAHFYEVYTAADGGHIAVGALEPQFYRALLEVLEIPEEEAPQWDQERWPELKQRLAEVFATRTRAEWAAAFADVDACTTPVYTMAEAPQQAHMAARGTFVEVDGVLQPAPAPRFSRTPGAITRSAPDPGADTETALTSWGVGADEVAALRSAGAVG
jgi:alpha-methylacyl-CoA racemase